MALCLGSAAQADGITLSGSAEMGLIGGALSGDDANGVALHTDVDLHFHFSTTTDNGLTIGFAADLSDLLGEDDPLEAFSRRHPQPRVNDRAD
ncbi:hypothetical protein roselon_02534 [Roseibacterium elongatum DSM 19469]|uniref:Porin domain-containing protein n=1 Tax=Roseicyclus elongatus DSM 19469 TaxID=1294273 RepID=W8RUE2_9RHOB|nr:hypothetical protein roselon_02534 [Roseibacterium elongatum DSM 19469]